MLDRVSCDLLKRRELALFQPFVDGVTLTDVPGVLLARGEGAAVPTICGTVAGDSWMFSRKVEGTLHELGSIAYYRGLSSAASQSLARAADALGRPIRTYCMDRPQPPKKESFYRHGEPPYGVKTPHGSEVAYFFGTLACRDQDYREEDFSLSRQMMQYLVNFAATGDPNAPGLPNWPLCTRKDPLTLHISESGMHAEDFVKTREEK